MNTAKEAAQIEIALKARQSGMYLARQYRDVWSKDGHLKPGVARRETRKHVESARKANHKVIALRLIGKNRPVSPVAEALMTRIESVRRSAVRWAEKQISAVQKKLEEHKGHIDGFAPNPPYKTTWNKQEQIKREAARQYHMFVMALTEPTVGDPKGYETTEARNARMAVRKMSTEGIEDYIRDCIRNAERAFTDYIFKMDLKAGAVVAARMHEAYNDVWGYSHLIVTKADGSEVIWHTKQIINQSKFHKYFPQWPSRIVKQITEEE